MQFLRWIIIAIGLTMNLLGCYFALAGVGVPVEEIEVNFWAVELRGKGLSTGVLFCVFGCIMMFIAAQYMKRMERFHYSNEKGEAVEGGSHGRVASSLRRRSP
jgi:hypothetical protein